MSDDANRVTLKFGTDSISLQVPEAGDLLATVKKRIDILTLLRQRPDLAPPAPCGGRGRCGRCRVILEEAGLGGVPEIHEDEKAVLSKADLDGGVRLACRLPSQAGMVLRIEDTGPSKIETRAEGAEIELEPVLVKKALVLPAGSLEDQRSSAARLEDALDLDPGSLPHHLARRLPAIPDGKSPITVLLEGDRPVALDIGIDTSESLWAAAVDIGTTTVAMYLVNLVDGKVEGTLADLNRQGPFGADVISRLEHARKGAAEAEELQKAVVGQLNDLLDELTGGSAIAKNDVHLMAVAGNTAMIHLMAGWDPAGLGEAPFLPAALETPPFAAGEIGLSDYPRLRIWPLPSLSAYVGADITGGILSSGMHGRKGTDLLLDIGTNGEMALGGADGLVCCSTAAGPAFEGAHLSSGVGSIAGAVDHVDFIDRHMSFTTIDRAPALGFCGSGVVDLVAFLVNSGLMDETGRLAERLPEDSGDRFAGMGIEIGETGPEFVWTIGERRLRFTQKDLREVQLAKAAIAAGVQTLLGQAGLSADNVNTLWLAGGFGSYIRPDSAGAIGLVPKNFIPKTRSLGNAAARGALLCLLNKHRLDEAREIALRARTIELSGRPDFQEAYIEGMMFEVGEENVT